MKENEIQIAIINVKKIESKDKSTSKSLMLYGIPVINGRNIKGFDTLQQWIDGVDFANKFDENICLQQLNATVKYVDTYGGNARKVLTKIYKNDGEVLYEFKD